MYMAALTHRWLKTLSQWRHYIIELQSKEDGGL